VYALIGVLSPVSIFGVGPASKQWQWLLHPFSAGSISHNAVVGCATTSDFPELADLIQTRKGIRMRYITQAIFLFAFWLALSGHYTPMLVVAGAASAVLCLLAAIRMRAADAEGFPIELFRGAVTYYPWLFLEIAKSGWAVTKIILHPSLPISPTMTVVRASQKSRAAVATYANSITLTPGTMTVGVNGHDLTIHALVKDGALDLEGGGMDRRVSQFEGTA
jgi:multicomponent Na+:H+ antiporter subunit E